MVFCCKFAVHIGSIYWLHLFTCGLRSTNYVVNNFFVILRIFQIEFNIISASQTPITRRSVRPTNGPAQDPESS